MWVVKGSFPTANVDALTVSHPMYLGYRSELMDWSSQEQKIDRNPVSDITPLL